jgi:DNA-binding XRE family transcriptional regulator
MISKETLGRRLREIRQRQKLTLKDVESTSGLSSTHISEIERGMTSPTIGALIRIAHALRKDASYFIEERKLEEVCITSEQDRPSEALPCGAVAPGAGVEPLTRGVLGGRVCAHEVAIEPGGSVDLGWLSRGQDVCFYCIEGKVLMRVGSQEMALAQGDSVHGALQGPPRIMTAEKLGGRVLVISDPGADSR